MIAAGTFAMRAAAALSVAALLLTACAPVKPRGVGSQAAGCPTGALGPAFNRIVPNTGQHDPGLIDRAVLHHVNRVRCGRGLRPVTSSQVAARAARIHASDMAALGFFSHNSPARGRREPVDRVRQAGGSRGYVAENIIEATYMAYENRTKYRVVDAGRCQFRDHRGQPMARHSYDTMAETFVRRWMASPGHRRNIMNPRLRRHGAALAPNGKPQLCGGVFAVQVFTG